MTANSFASVSLDPPLVLWSVARHSRRFPAFADAAHYAIHFLGAEHRDLAGRFAGATAEPFAGLDVAAGQGGVPLLSGLPVLECRSWARYDGGDHLILVGEVVALSLHEHEPLVFHGGALGSLAPPDADGA